MQPPEWTGKLLGEMHNNRITYDDIAERLGVTKSYVSMVLNGARTPQDAQVRFEQAYDEVLVGRKVKCDEGTRCSGDD